MTDPIVSHGRGGQGNIGADSTPYTDGEIIREGVSTPGVDGAYSTGFILTVQQRGGSGNIASAGMKATYRNSEEVVPEAAMHPSMEDQNYHVGRGGDGNAHLAKAEPPRMMHEGLADKLKNMIFRSKKNSAASGGGAA
ncbi:MAG: hypothetical protein M1826_000665 [Phylliscum demangeonii]|nr:MAG: hypothetical protein M1826_000665 [Phylliscum demangeonii]